MAKGHGAALSRKVRGEENKCVPCDSLYDDGKSRCFFAPIPCGKMGMGPRKSFAKTLVSHNVGARQGAILRNEEVIMH